MGIAHLDQAPVREFDLGHIRGRWTNGGVAAGCVNAGVRRIEIPAGGWSTPAHEHGREEEIFYVLAGRGLSWQDGEVAEVGAGGAAGGAVAGQTGAGGAGEHTGAGRATGTGQGGHGEQTGGGGQRGTHTQG